MKHMSPGKPGDIYSILNEKSDNMAFELLVESGLDDGHDDCHYDKSYYDTDLDAAADRILNQFDSDYL